MSHTRIQVCGVMTGHAWCSMTGRKDTQAKTTQYSAQCTIKE